MALVRMPAWQAGLWSVLLGIMCRVALPPRQKPLGEQDRHHHQVQWSTSWIGPHLPLPKPNKDQKKMPDSLPDQWMPRDLQYQQRSLLPRILPTAQRSAAPPAQTRKKLKKKNAARSLGARQVSTWKEMSYKLPWTGCTRCTGWNCKHVASQPGVRLDAWADYEDAQTCATGKPSKPKPSKDLLGTDSENGRHTSSSRPTRVAHAGDCQHPEPGVQDPLGQLARSAAMCRPRCYRAAAFQRPAHLHPFARRPKPERKTRCPHKTLHRRSQTKAADEQAAAQGHRKQHRVHKVFPNLNCRLPKLSCMVPGFPKQTVNADSLPQTNGSPGPKSGTSLCTMCLFIMIRETGGVRVPPAATTGGELAVALATAGKQRGTARATASAPQFVTASNPGILKTAKRAFRRARHRAQTSAEQGTWYRGRWHTVASLGRLPPALRAESPKVEAYQAYTTHKAGQRAMHLILEYQWPQRTHLSGTAGVVRASCYL